MRHPATRTRPPTLRSTRHVHSNSRHRRLKRHIPRNSGTHPAEHHLNSHLPEHLKTYVNNIIISGQLMSTNAHMALQLRVIAFFFLSMVLRLGPGRFFSSVILYTVGRPSPWQGRYIHTGLHKYRINADMHTSTGIRTHDHSVPWFITNSAQPL